ncbi:hypothetical protein EDC04DRAFT_2907546 [Pisolithus marmoratus]|nr:hypothetical protein EDC04DRAFT_2907546 [Pisolithus marmoratus]
MHKHSLSVPSFPASAPTSPAVTRLNKTERDHFHPATPQRSVRPVKSSSRSPISPASTYSTPYTPLSLRSFPTPSSSTLTTPASVTASKGFPALQSPGCERPFALANESLVDVAANWRSRANENGIKVALTSDSRFWQRRSVVLLPAPLLTGHRRSRTQSNISPACDATQQVQTPARRTLGVLNTPPPKSTNSNALKVKGSYTAPALLRRRRPSFGQISAELFDIDENAPEPYPQSLPTASQSLILQDPFNASSLSTIPESIPQDFCPAYPDMHINAIAKPTITSCLVCGRSGGRLVVIEPCKHAHCNACFTSALNIVGEKDMECAVCKASVLNFAFHTVPFCETDSSSSINLQSHQMSAFFDNAASPLQQRSSRGDYPFFPNVSIPKPLPSLTSAISLYDASRDRSPTGLSTPTQGNENIVLRIDNVPWDITPPAIAAWLKHPVVRVHVLLDQRGKTLSHAYVELATEDIAKAALREVQNSVLGKGKRARGVTVTRSSQEELMRALFPSWKGAFAGCRPTLSGVGPEHLAVVVTTGLVTIAELDALMRLIQSPDSHFLKVPSLPFYFLISILSKFPAEIESGVYWSAGVTDVLFALTYNALTILVARFQERGQADDLQLLNDLLEVGISCQAFTTQQVEMMMTLEVVCKSTQSTTRGLSQNYDFSIPAPIPLDGGCTMSPYSAIAREFGLNEELVQALAHRLGGLF